MDKSLSLRSLHRSLKIFLIFILLVALSATFGLVDTLAAPMITVNPNSGPSNSKVTVSGSGFTGNNNAGIRWDGVDQSSFTMPDSGSFSVSFTIPAGAAPGKHTIAVCNNCGGGEFEEQSSAPFTVTAPATNTPPPPTNTSPPPTNTPRPATDSPVPPPTNTVELQPTLALPSPTQPLAATFPVPPTPVGACDDLGLGTESVIVDFEEDLAAIEAEQSVSFERSGEIITPRVGTRSGTRALRSTVGMEFGSVGLPIRMSFSRPLSAIGLFAGLEEALYVEGDVTARLTAYGYRSGGSDVVLLAQDQVQLPAAPSPTQYCLRVQAGVGETIIRAEVEYQSATGSSIFEPRLIDDLTLAYAEAVAPMDRPPVVEILEPSRDDRVRAYDYYRIQVLEDRSLRRVWYRIEGSDPVEIGFRLIEPPSRYQALVGINLGVGRYMITFGAEDSLGQTDEAFVTVLSSAPTPAPPVDIEAVALEAVQVVQCLGNALCSDNSVSLVANKPTLVRAYIRLTTGTLDRPVRGQLCNVFWGLCVQSFNAVIPDAEPSPVTNDRGDINATLNFLMPTGWIPEDVPPVASLDLEVTVNDRRSVEETDYDNNSVTGLLNLVDPRELKVNFLPVSVSGTAPALAQRANMADWLERVWPLSSLQIINARSANPVSVSSLSNSNGSGCGRDWSRMMSLLRARRNLDRDADLVGSDVHYVGMVPQGVPTGGILGCGEMPGSVAASIVTPGTRFGAEVAAQELAHNKGLRHAPGCNAGNLDSSYPVSTGNTDVWGVDVGQLQVYDPTATFDYMGYCGSENNTWTSRYTYYNMMRALPRLATATEAGVRGARLNRQEEPQVYLVVAGVAYTQEIDVVSGPYRISLRQGDDTPAGPFTVEILHETGDSLYSRDFRATALSNHEPDDSGTFFLTLPILEGSQTILFHYRGEEIGRLAASPSAPDVQLISPIGGEDWGTSGAQVIRWRAQDPDGDALRFMLQASDDGGGRWITLVTDLEGVDSYEIETANLAGGEYILRVLATDGFHTSEARSEAAVRVGSKPPTVHLMAPADGTTFPTGEMVILQGLASDLEDGSVSEEAYLWTSDLDGELDRGSRVWSLALTPGQHTITLSVNDLDGMSAQESVHITVLGPTDGEAEAEQPTDPQAPEQSQRPFDTRILVLIGLGIGSLVGVVLIGFAVGAWLGSRGR